MRVAERHHGRDSSDTGPPVQVPVPPGGRAAGAAPRRTVAPMNVTIASQVLGLPTARPDARRSGGRLAALRPRPPPRPLPRRRRRRLALRHRSRGLRDADRPGDRLGARSRRCRTGSTGVVRGPDAARALPVRDAPPAHPGVARLIPAGTVRPPCRSGASNWTSTSRSIGPTPRSACTEGDSGDLGQGAADTTDRGVRSPVVGRRARGPRDRVRSDSPTREPGH